MASAIYKLSSPPELKSVSPVRMAKPFNNREIEQKVTSILESGRLVQGKTVEEFEAALTAYIGCKNVICVNSGTAALHSAVMAAASEAKSKERNEIVTTPLSFAATANAVIHAGGIPVFCDVEEDTFNIDPNLVEDKVNEKTLAIEPVDVYGLPADLVRIGEIAKSNGIPVIEDAAEAIGASHKGKKIGSISELSCFSTYATKNLHTAEGGFVTTNDDRYAQKIRLIRNQGQSSRYNQVMLGYNFRMLEIVAAIGLGQLPLLDGLNEKRRQNAIYLEEELARYPFFGFQKVENPKEHAWYLFSVTLDEKKPSITRDAFVLKLKERGIEADVAWPTPIHLQPYFQETFGFRKGDFPMAERICREVFQLPIHPFLTREELDRILRTVKDVLA
jgi:perosamine synthetase